MSWDGRILNPQAADLETVMRTNGLERYGQTGWNYWIRWNKSALRLRRNVQDWRLKTRIILINSLGAQRIIHLTAQTTTQTI